MCWVNSILYFLLSKSRGILSAIGVDDSFQTSDFRVQQRPEPICIYQSIISFQRNGHNNQTNLDAAESSAPYTCFHESFPEGYLSKHRNPIFIAYFYAISKHFNVKIDKLLAYVVGKEHGEFSPTHCNFMDFVHTFVHTLCHIYAPVFVVWYEFKVRWKALTLAHPTVSQKFK